jgi:hypothetical protein
MAMLRDPDDALVVLFKHEAVKNEAKSLAEGRPIHDDREMVEIRIPGSKDVKVFPALARSHWNTNPYTGEMTPITYAERFARQYAQFKAKLAQTKSGTPLDLAPFLTEGARASLRAQNIYTVEQLAHIDGQELKNLGPGGREQKNLALEYIADSKAGAPNLQMAAELEALRARNAVLEEDIKLKALRAAETKSADGDLDEMTSEQLRDYVTTHTGQAPIGNLNHKTLKRMAAEATPSKAA